MTVQQIVYRWIDGFARGDLNSVTSPMSEDFVFDATNLPNPLTKAQWSGFIKTLQNAFPDVDFNWKTERMSETSTDLSYRIEGTHTEELRLSPMGMTDFRATGGSFSLPKDVYSLTMDGGKIVRIDVDPPEGAGLGGILQQLGLS